MSVFQRSAGIAAFCLVVSLSAAACGKKAPVASPPPPPPPAAPAAPPAPPAPPAAPTPVAPPRALTDDEIFAQMSLADLNAKRPLTDVYFDLDASTIKDDAKASLSTNATWLKRYTATRINIEGHCRRARHRGIQPWSRRAARELRSSRTWWSSACLPSAS